jgi:hypothetical protein
MDTPKYATGGRVGYNQGDLVLGGDLYSRDDYTKFITNYADQIKSPALYRSIFTKDEDGNVVVKEDSDFSYENLFGKATGDTKKEDRQSVYKNLDSKIGDAQTENYLFPPPKGTEDLAKAIKSDVTADLKASKQFEFEPPRGGGAAFAAAIPEEKKKTTNDNNDPEPTEIDPKTLMRENAELFKELLGEGNEKKLKDARIQDASDYLLKFFEGSQREGATVGSSGAEVAAFATSRPSKTEKVKEQIEKGDQTAVALAINDYIAGKRSKEQIDAIIAKSDLALTNKKLALDYAETLSKGVKAFPGYVADSKEIGYVNRVIDGLRKSGLSTLPLEKVTSTEMEEQFKFDPETDTGKIFIETDTKTTYTLVSDGKGGYTKNILDQG